MSHIVGLLQVWLDDIPFHDLYCCSCWWHFSARCNFLSILCIPSCHIPNPYVSWQNLMTYPYVTHPYVTHPTFSGWHPTSLLVQSLPSELQLAFSEGALCTQTLVTLQNFGPPLGTSHHWGIWGSLNKLNEITMHTHAHARTRTRTRTQYIYIYICAYTLYTHTHTHIYIYACACACACVYQCVCVMYTKTIQNITKETEHVQKTSSHVFLLALFSRKIFGRWP